MEVVVKGEIYKVSQKKDKSGYVVNVLVPRSDGMSDNLTIFTPKTDYKVKGVFQGKVNFYSDMCNEVV